MLETCPVHGVYPHMDWMPDSSSIIFWAGGKIHRINADGSGHAEIPFSVSDTRAVVDPPRPQLNGYSDTFTRRMPRFSRLSPHGRQVVFALPGRLLIYTLDASPPPPLTPPYRHYP